MEAKPIPLTPEGKRQLEEELAYLVNVRRPEVAEKIHSAKMDGDIMENAGYDAAKEEQAMLEGRIAYLENLLRNAVLIENDGQSTTVRLGSVVTIQEEGQDDLETYVIVGAAEADPTAGRISNESPLGKALMGRKVGDRVRVMAPGGEVRFILRAVE
ncbi:MAG: transcription elongation factor GreA [Anaerolineae bacterium]|nr:transcription elongation factor GreA [Anaerolineae bacterium]